MTKNNLDITEFCEKCNISIKDFSDLMKNDPDIDSFVLLKVLKCLNLSLIELLED